jgi:hypothetical protein
LSVVVRWTMPQVCPNWLAPTQANRPKAPCPDVTGRRGWPRPLEGGVMDPSWGILLIVIIFLRVRLVLKVSITAAR